MDPVTSTSAAAAALSCQAKADRFTGGQ